MPDHRSLNEIRRSYSVLGVPETASPEEIRKRYLALAQQWHPDKWSGDPVAQWRATEKMKRINEAFARIKDAPLLHNTTAPSGSAGNAATGNVTILVTSGRPTSSDVLMAGWIGIGLGLYCLCDSLLALFGVTVIRDALSYTSPPRPLEALLQDIRQLSMGSQGSTAYAWQSWIVSFGDAAERVLALRSLLGLIVASAGIGVLQWRRWARAALATACGGAVVFGALGVWFLLRWGWFRGTSVPLEAVLLAGVSGYALRLLCGDNARRQFAGAPR